MLSWSSTKPNTVHESYFSDSGSDTSTVDASTRSMCVLFISQTPEALTHVTCRAFPHVVPSQSAGTTSHGVVGVGKPYYTGGHNRYRQQYSAPMPPTYMPYVPYGAVAASSTMISLNFPSFNLHVALRDVKEQTLSPKQAKLRTPAKLTPHVQM